MSNSQIEGLFIGLFWFFLIVCGSATAGLMWYSHIVAESLK